ncbi:hypothetical protein [Geobacillus sp. GHH01]|uniref:hypothetical protein n=1 Tax=Geobacillus sp. GHH01 TaxID=1233873 RepID=UPI001F45EC6F|nr:hypothetical protein [Geobacillus sp. GHH01]
MAAVIMNTLIIRLNIHLRQLTEDFDELIVQPIFHHSNQRTLLIVNDNTTNTFIQHIRRRLSILERPLITTRGDGKSYIYSNFNSKYAQMALTILRTYYNFCLAYKTKETVGTPAQRLGIAKKQFDLKEIIYMQ